MASIVCWTRPRSLRTSRSLCEIVLFKSSTFEVKVDIRLSLSFSFFLRTRYRLRGLLRNKLKAASRIAKKQMLRRIPQASQRPTFSPSASVQRRWRTTPRRSGGMVSAVLELYQYFSSRADDPDAMGLKLQVAKECGTHGTRFQSYAQKLSQPGGRCWRAAA